MTDVQLETLRVRLERYLDLLPRTNAKTEEIGPFTLFVSTGAWPYYARPRLSHTGGFSANEVRAVWERQQRLRVPVSFEWVHEVSPGLADAATAAGLTVERRPLLVLDKLAEVPVPPGITIRFLAADDPDMARAIAAVDLGFGVSGSDVGPAGAQQRDERAIAMRAERISYFRDRIAQGMFRWATAEDSSGPVGGGSYHPRADVAEITGIGTVPALRRRGIAAAVTATLTADALANGVTLAFLSAGSLEAARIYERVGFRHIGTACVAGPPSS